MLPSCAKYQIQKQYFHWLICFSLKESYEKNGYVLAGHNILQLNWIKFLYGILTALSYTHKAFLYYKNYIMIVGCQYGEIFRVKC